MIRDYRILERIPATTGTVYIAERRGRRYAVKEFLGCRYPVDEGEVCPEALRPAQERAERFHARLRESTAYLRAHLREDGRIGAPLEVLRHGRTICLVTRFIEGCGLQTDQLHAHLTGAQMNVLLKTLLLQLEALQGIGFIHGDLKPENVIVTRRGSLFAASLIDLDTGFRAGQEPERVDHTPEYAAPEMLWLQSVLDSVPDQRQRREAFARVGCASDMFALGCVMLHMLTGQAWMAKDGAGRPVPPGRCLLQGDPLPTPPVHPVWRSCVRRMTAADPALRPTPREIIREVNACIATGLYEELKKPWAGWQLLPDMPLPSGEARLAALRGQRMLLWHMEDCWQLPRPLPWRPDHGRALRRAHSGSLKQLRRMEKRVRELSGRIGLLRPFRVLRRGRRVFAGLPLPEGCLYPLSALHTLAAPEEIDELIAGLLRDMQRLHDEGLLHAALGEESIAVLVPDGGRPQLLLTDPHRLCTPQMLRSGCLPRTDSTLLAPETARLITALNAQMRSVALDLTGPASDVFSLALLLHVMLTGEKPLIAADACASLPAAASQSAIVLHDSLAPERSSLLRQMLIYEPDDRLPSCGEAADRFEAIRAAEKAITEPVLLIWQEESPEPFCFGAGLPEEFLDPGDASLLRVALPDTMSALPQKPAAEPPSLIISDLEEICPVDDYSELPSGFLQRSVRCGEDGMPLWLRPLPHRIAYIKEHADWFEGRRRAWNAFAAAAGALRVEGIAQHGGVLYALSPCKEEWGSLLHADAASCSPEVVRGWICALLEQLRALHRHGLRCPLISPGEVLFHLKRPPVQARLHAFDHFWRAEQPGDLRRWAEVMRDRCPVQRCGSRAMEQPWGCLAPETCDVIFGGADAVLSPAADLFSLGVTLHVLLTGRHPVQHAENWRDAFARGQVVVDAKIDFPIRCLIMRMLGEHPGDRPSGCDEALALLDQIDREAEKVRTVTLRSDGCDLTGSTASLWAIADGREYPVASARIGANGRAAFRGCMPCGFVYEVRCGDYRHVCRWRLT